MVMPKRMKSEFEYVISIGDELGKYVDEWIAVECSFKIDRLKY
jgi:hypothetical protein